MANTTRAAKAAKPAAATELELLAAGLTAEQEIRARALAAAVRVAFRSPAQALAAAEQFADYIQKGR